MAARAGVEGRPRVADAAEGVEGGVGHGGGSEEWRRWMGGFGVGCGIVCCLVAFWIEKVRMNGWLAGC